MEVKILGAGCYNCQALESNVINALAELDLAAEVVRITEAGEIAACSVDGVPALIVNGSVKVCGRVPQKEEIKEWLRQEDRQGGKGS
ncbi:thioredoxin family protein [Dethiobacter alkaliphilus]|uniref:Redox-active disulfide protein 2 n=1 Tax=Dethiobacter alkaliphilus AHT 1 TaxID=555088 RepID=C0GJ09_DETAL|nr:thioredoxin family protein [Dethiobacter alkaliphilus]EEG76642.1 redox-active disulfide protein 2 [Dethiobacter alkaliphilus AHT 1]